jgi:hypothetical protein
MAAIASELTILRDESVRLYLRVTPEETGRFVKRATVRFVDGPTVTLLLESTVVPAFSITPSSVALKPGDETGVEIKVRSNFGERNFTATTADPFISLRTLKRDELVLTLHCQLKDQVQGKSPPFQIGTPLMVHAGDKSREYRMRVTNMDAFSIRPEPIVPVYQGGRWTAKVFIMGFTVNQQPLDCEVTDRNSKVTVEIAERKSLGAATAIYDLTILGNLEGHKSIPMDWRREGSKDVLFQSEVMLRP